MVTVGFVPVLQIANQVIVSVGKHVGFNRHFIADDALDRKAAAIHLWANRFDHDPCASLLLLRHGVSLIWLHWMRQLAAWRFARR